MDDNLYGPDVSFGPIECLCTLARPYLTDLSLVWWLFIR